MEHREQLEWEARAGKPAAIAAFVAALLPIASQVYVTASFDQRPDDTAEILDLADREGDPFIVGGVITALALVGILIALGYLYRATRYRRSRLIKAAAVLLVLGCVASAAVVVWRQAEFVSAAHAFADNPPAVPAGTEDRADFLDDEAEDLVRDRLATVAGIGFGANIALGFAVLLIALNAMRAGLLSRFMGIVGIMVGVLYALPLLGGPQVIQLFWLPALGLLYLGRWPGGRGPAWESGEEEPWPSAQARFAEAHPEPEDDEEEEEDAAPEPAPHPRSKKRKRKR